MYNHQNHCYCLSYSVRYCECECYGVFTVYVTAHVMVYVQCKSPSPMLECTHIARAGIASAHADVAVVDVARSPRVAALALLPHAHVQLIEYILVGRLQGPAPPCRRRTRDTFSTTTNYQLPTIPTTNYASQLACLPYMSMHQLNLQNVRYKRYIF